MHPYQKILRKAVPALRPSRDQFQEISDRCKVVADLLLSKQNYTAALEGLFVYLDDNFDPVNLTAEDAKGFFDRPPTWDITDPNVLRGFKKGLIPLVIFRVLLYYGGPYRVKLKCQPSKFLPLAAKYRHIILAV